MWAFCMLLPVTLGMKARDLDWKHVSLMWSRCKVPFPPVRVEPPFILLMLIAKLCYSHACWQEAECACIIVGQLRSDVGLAPGAVVSANITVSEGGAVGHSFVVSRCSLHWRQCYRSSCC